MVSQKTNWKIVLWIVAISTLLLLVATTALFQSNVDAIDQQLDNMRTNEIR